MGGEEVLSTVVECLRYEGDEGAHPDRAALQSVRFNEIVTYVRRYLEWALKGAVAVAEVSLPEGPPFYPVMWGFAFLIVRPEGAEVFLGASSD